MIHSEIVVVSTQHKVPRTVAESLRCCLVSRNSPKSLFQINLS